ncbi:hypothetical protein [Hyphomicrobium sp.]|uniref:hypothetical protein n=1 Tax=Hyphomicrobium sp. TaxID=82 RepID=UPI0025C60394|nr:hypothetical protein [Hyphomicrobium sp.]MCC7250266.1 hypothetical protein [Hyphomicrobium sp.]
MSPAVADGDDERDTGGFEEDSSVTGGSEDDDAGPRVTRSREQSVLTIEGLIYRREDLPEFPFTALGDSPPAATRFVPFNSSELKGEDYTAGLRGTLQGTIFDQPVEFSAFYMNPIGLEQTKLDLNQGTGTNTDAVYDDGPGADITSTNSDNIFGMTVHHETKLFGAEANVVRPFGIPGLLIGARGIYFGEQLSSTTMDQADDVPWLGSDNQRDHVSIRTDNYLLGMQIGLQHMFDVGDFVRIGGSVKGGFYNNFVDRNRTYVSENRPDLRSFDTSHSASVFAQGLEINPRLELKLTDNVFLTASGSFLWLNNVSTPLQHFASVEDIDGNRDVGAKDDVFFYGGTVGLTFLLDPPSPSKGALTPIVPDTSPATIGDIEDRIAELEEMEARKGNRNVSLTVSGHINRMLLAWDDGADKDVYVVDNTASRSRLEFKGAARIARGWSAGYILSLGLDDKAANDVDQLNQSGEGQIEQREAAWWMRSNSLGTVTVGHTSPATDNIILKDVGGIMPGAANIATIGGSFYLRRADSYEQGDGALVISGAFTTTLNDISAGASVDTLRRDVVRYDAPRISGQWGNVDMAVAWGEDDFYDFAAEYGINYNDWKFRFGAGYLRDTDENGRPNSRRDREEYKGSASLLHIPSGLFGTAAYVRREFHGFDESAQAVFGENTVGLVTPAGSNRPPIDYLYTAFGLRRDFWSFGDTSIYGEFAQVDDAITGLREADLREVTDSRLQMIGAAISQDIDAAGMDVYAGFRYYTFDTEGVQFRTTTGVTGPSPVPLTDLMIGYAGTRIKF